MSVRHLPIVALVLLGLLFATPSSSAEAGLQLALSGAPERSFNATPARSPAAPSDLLVTSAEARLAPVERTLAEPSALLPDSPTHAVAVVPSDRADAARLVSLTRVLPIAVDGAGQSLAAVASARPFPWLLVAGPGPRAPPVR